MSYRLDHKAVQRVAEDHYGIVGPVVVARVKKQRNPRTGLYNIRERDNGQCALWLHEREGAEYVRHHIRIDGARPVREVARTLAHELEHVRQAEAIIRSTESQDLLPPIRSYMKAGGRKAYRTREAERLARAAGDSLGPLVLRECFK